MITNFDKKNIAAHFKAEFAECLEDADYEGAIDYLLKYTEETGFADFHLVCGMLYLEMTQDSDDGELCVMAFREFMMHLRRFPDCRNAYRNLLATLFLRGDTRSILECSFFIKNRGFDLENMYDELADVGILTLADNDEDPPDIDALFKDGEFGELDPVHIEADAQEPYTAASAEPENAAPTSKIIRFCGKSEAETGDMSYSCGEADDGDGGHAGNGGEVDSDDADADDTAEIVENLYKNAQDRLGSMILDDLRKEIESELGLSADGKKVRSGEDILRDAEIYLERGQYERAFDELDNISRKDEHLYYCALAMRAYMHLDDGDLREAERALDEAEAIRPKGAIIGTLRCRLYIFQKRVAEIPDVLKNIDVKDFIDSNHVYKAFDLAREYCDRADLEMLAEDYIDEYNILDMRRIYAQMRYNDGDRAVATHELYIMSRVFYDDINARFYYLAARSGEKALIVDEEAPQPFLNAVVESLMDFAESGVLTEEAVSSETFVYGVEFMFSLEFRNERKVLKRMFDTVRIFAASELLDSKMRDVLVSPYAEPIVKAVVLTELLRRDGKTDFIFESEYCPIGRSDISLPPDDYPFAYVAACAFVGVLCGHESECVLKIAEQVRKAVGTRPASERAIMYCIIRRATAEEDLEFDDRIAYALGYTAKSAAEREYRELKSQLAEYSE
ncbi:MAG: hypothetical protein NC184_07290 [Roseburia sp.]|nr:hypothetical protein [Roseburia sp.]